MAKLQHPFMAAVHPWLVGAAFTLLAISLLVAVWGLLADGHDMLRSILACIAASAVVGSIAKVANPFLDVGERFAAWCAMATLVLGLCTLWEFVGFWSFRPFRFLVWVPTALSLGRIAMTIPTHVRSGAEQIVVLLNQVPDPVKNALIIGAALVTFLAACVKFVKTLVE